MTARPAEARAVTPGLLRAWPLPSALGGKESRGRVLVIGGGAETPGGVQLAAESALRAGAGKLQVVTADAVAVAVAVAVPEALVRGIAVRSDGGLDPAALASIRDLGRGCGRHTRRTGHCGQGVGGRLHGAAARRGRRSSGGGRACHVSDHRRRVGPAPPRRPGCPDP